LATPKDVKLKWKAQAKQLRFLRACGLSHPFDGGIPKKPVAKIIGYGGAAGGGKSDALLMAAIIYCFTYNRAKVAYFRRHFTQLEGPGSAIMRSEEILAGIAKYNAQKRRWTFPNGSIIQFAYLDSDEDVHNYHSQQLDVIMFDEASQFSWYQVSYMQSRIRSVKGYPTFTAMATNPGGPGAAWFKSNFVKAGPPEIPVDVEVEPGRFRTHIFIPATLADNAILERMDPEYRKNLENLPEHLRRQLLDGDWDTAEGAAFPEFRQNVHVIPPFAIPEEWLRFRSLDWGYAKPYCVGWYAVDHDGRLYKYRELYGWGGRDDVGSKEDPEDVAEKIIQLEAGEKISYAVADSAIFGGRQDNFPTVAEQFATAFGSRATHWQPITKGSGSRIAGKLEIHHRLKYSDTEEPMLLFFNNCRHTVRTFPNMMLHDRNPEDMDSDLEDHAVDETRYACQSRPITPQRFDDNKLTDIQKHKKRMAEKKKRNGFYRIV
jgi:hypothetical protein